MRAHSPTSQPPTEGLLPAAMIFWLLVWAAVQAFGLAMHRVDPKLELGYFRPLEGSPSAPVLAAGITGIALAFCLIYWLLGFPKTSRGRWLYFATFVAALAPVVVSVMVLGREGPASAPHTATVERYAGIPLEQLDRRERWELSFAIRSLEEWQGRPQFYKGLPADAIRRARGEYRYDPRFRRSRLR